MTEESDRPTPSTAISGIDAYAVPKPQAPVDLHLEGNVGPAPPSEVLDGVAAPEGEEVRSYPSRQAVAEAVAERFGLPADRLLVTAGADEAILRTYRAVLEPGRNVVMPEPTFSMMRRFAALAGAEVRAVDWSEGGYPIEAVLEEVDESTGLITVVSPNNPTGLVADEAQVRRLAEAAPGAIVLVDHAYIEFADDDLTDLAVEYDNIVVTRTLSKAWGLAGMRVGYAVAAPPVVDWLDTAGNPYPVAVSSVRYASHRLNSDDDDVDRYIERVQKERRELEAMLGDYGGRMTESHGNFAFGRFEDADWIHQALGGMGIGVRAFPDAGGLDDALRISCAGNEAEHDRLKHALRTIFEPEGVLFDLDGVLADVSQSYRQAIIQTADQFGLTLTDADVSRWKSAGEANNDWILTQRILADAGIEAGYDEIKAEYEARYQGEGEFEGLWRREEFMYPLERIEALCERYPVGIVTGRPRRDADRFFEQTGLGGVIDACVCMEDAPQKPEPDPVELLMEQLGIERAWMVGDTPDDAQAARAAGVLPFGVIAPGEEPETMRPALIEAGCARIVDGLGEFERLLP